MTQHDSVLGGRYKLDQIIGRGGMAEVWRARDIRLGRDVAVKRLRVDLATDPTFQERFRREAQAAAGLNHPNIVATYDTGEEADEKTGIHVPYIVMELVEGHTLRDLLRTDRRILPEKSLEWTMGVLDALNYSHRAGIVHRDIKPANVMVTPSGSVKVMDFGIARAVADTSATMTQTAAVIGTAQYLSPEQARGETVDSRSDIYSAGCLLYELLTGRPPFIGESPVSVAYQHVREAPIPPSTLDPVLTPPMDAIVLKSLAKDPAQRYQTAKQMRDDIARLLAGQQVTAVVPSMAAAETTAPTQAIGAAAAPAAAAQTGTVAAVAAPEPMTQEPEPRPRRSPWGWIIALLLAALLAVGAISAYKFFAPVQQQSTGTVQVPSVKGLSETAADAQLTSNGFKVTSKHVNGDAKTQNQVTDQDPVGGSQAQKGSTVAITVNDGPATNKVPSNLIGMTEKQARAALAKVGFTDANISTQEASEDQEKEHLDYQAGQVVTSNPAPGADVVPSTQKVVLYLATGKSTVPNVRTKKLDDAKTTLTNLGFTNIKSTSVDVQDKAQDGVVQDQDPTDGTSYARTDRITLTVGRYTAPSATPTPSTATVPDVRGKSKADATAALQTAGFKVAVTQSQVSQQSQDGVVVDQNPKSGDATPGSTVTISVGQYTAPAAPTTTSAPTTSSPTSSASASASSSAS